MTDVKNRLKQKLTGQTQPASQSYLDAGFVLKGTFGKGQVFENPQDQSLVYISPSFSSTNQDFNRRILDGETPKEILKSK